LLLLVGVVLAHEWSGHEEWTGKDAKLVFDAVPLFEKFQQDYGKTYSETERDYRFSVFFENLKLAEERNKLGTETHGVTQFMDLTPEEFKQTYLNFLPLRREELGVPKYQPTARVSCAGQTQCNYANLGAVTPVKNQGQCGSCWAFSATESVETATFMAGNALPTLSTQQIVSCDNAAGGCNGGDTTTAFNYVIKAGGLESSASYPYTSGAGVTGTCKFQSSLIAASISSWQWGITPCNTASTISCNNQNETGLYSVIQNMGPMSICVDANAGWQTYTGGVYSGPCAHGYMDLNHCVQLTGYGTSGSTQYWLVRNSWGTTWGEAGYIKLIYGQNECGVADEVNYAIGK